MKDQENITRKWKSELVELLSYSLDNLNYEETTRVGEIYSCYAPKSLFKYYRGNDLDIDAIEGHKMWYSIPAYFNDPFDCSFYVDLNKCFNNIIDSDVSLREACKGNCDKRNELLAIIRKDDSVQNGIDIFESELTKMKGEMGVACLSERNDSNLMWGHYANSHRGICVEYELAAFNQQLGFTPVPILYSENKIVLENLLFERKICSFLIKSLCSKSKEWRYEHEWRILRDKEACGDRWRENGALLDTVKPKAIYLGCKCEEGIKARLKSICNNQGIPIYRMQTDEQEFKLNAIKIE